MTGKPGIGALSREFWAGVVRSGSQLVVDGFKKAKSWLIKTPAERVAGNNEKLKKLEDWSLRRGNAEDAFRASNPNATPEQVAAFLNADPKLVSPKMPLTTTQKWVAATAVAVSPFALTAGEGFASGAWGNPQSNSPSTKILPVFSAVADSLEIFGHSKANFMTDFSIGAYAMGNDYRYDNASPEERKQKGLQPSFERVRDLSKTIPHAALSTSAKDYVLSRSDSVAAEEKGKVAIASAAASAASATLEAAYNQAKAASAPELAALEQQRLAEEKRKAVQEQAAQVQQQINQTTIQIGRAIPAIEPPR